MGSSLFNNPNSKKKFWKNLTAKTTTAKKAQLEVSFNWIFVLIAGAVILGFFIMVTKHEKQSSTDQTSRAISGKLEALLSAIQQNPDAVQTQDSLNVEMDFNCDITGNIYDHSYNLKDSNFRSSLSSQIIFTPKIVGGSKTIAWTQLYSSPYPVAYVLYFSDEKTKYIFMNSGHDKIKELYLKMPDQFEKEFMTQAEIESLDDQGFREYIIIMDAADSANLKSTIKKKSAIVKISTSSKLVYFEDGAGAGETTVSYSTDETIFGAIISGDKNLYGCTMDKLMHAARIVGEINLNRTEMFAQTDDYKCKLFYTTGLPQEYIESIIGNSTYAESENYNELENAMTSLQNINRDMARASCPTLY